MSRGGLAALEGVELEGELRRLWGELKESLREGWGAGEARVEVVL